MKFRKKPVVVDAVQFVVWDLAKIPLFIDLHNVTYPVYKNELGKPFIVIPTIEGPLNASNLDWIIKGICGEVYPCKPDIFEKTYEKVE